MSKRSSRRKRREQAQKKAARLTAPVLIEQGKAAFSQANYSAAVESWEQARSKPNAPTGLPAALAEAYFRRALTGPGPALADLQQAARLAPADPRYRYHLALAHHRLNQIEQAEPLYRQLLAASPPFQRAAFPLAQLLLEKGQEITSEPVWSHLSEAERNHLSAALALSRMQPVAALRHLAAHQADSLWSGLAAFALGESATTCQDLETALSIPRLHPLPRGVARYYLGILAAQAGQTEAALTQWQAAQKDGLDTPHLRQNLAALLYQQALAEWQAGHAPQALQLAEQSHALNGNNSGLTSLQQQLNLEAGYAEAQQGRWDKALRHWESAQAAGDHSRQLLINLALAHEKLERFRQAADLWREALRRRPRSANHPDALSDEQVARLWQHVAESYGKAGDHEQAITTYRNALKWAPDNVELQLHLVDALQAEGRWQAADNELERILEKRPNHVPALTRRAESYEADGDLETARKLWQRVLTIEPQHPAARQQLAHLYETEGGRYIAWGRFDKAIATLEEGLDHAPDNPGLHAWLGAAHADQDDFDQARRCFEQALALDPANLSTFHTILLVWLDHRRWDEVDQTLNAVKALTPPAPASFLLDLAHHCDVAQAHVRGQEFRAFTEQLYPDDPEVLLEMARLAFNNNEDNRAAGYLRRILRHHPNHAEANLRLGAIYYTLNQTRLAKRHWAIAEQQARQENDALLLAELQITKNSLMYGIEPTRGLSDLLGLLPPDLSDLFGDLS